MSINPSMTKLTNRPKTNCPLFRKELRIVEHTQVATEIAAGRGRFHPSNPSGQSAAALYTRYEELKAKYSKTIMPPTTRQVFGDNGAPTPSSFLPPSKFPGNRSETDSFAAHSNSMNFNTMLEEILTKCTQGGRMHPERFQAFKDFLQAGIAGIDTALLEGADCNARLSDQMEGQQEQEDVYKWGQAQLAWEDALSVADYNAIDRAEEQAAVNKSVAAIAKAAEEVGGFDKIIAAAKSLMKGSAA